LEDVESGGAGRSSGQGDGKRGLVDATAARGVYESASGLHLGEARCIDEVSRLVGQWTVQRDGVGFLEQRIERRELSSERALHLKREPRALCIQDAHAEASGTPRHGLTDAAEPDDAQRTIVHARAEHEALRPTLPLAASNEAVTFGDAAGGRQEQPEREV